MLFSHLVCILLVSLVNIAGSTGGAQASLSPSLHSHILSLLHVKLVDSELIKGHNGCLRDRELLALLLGILVEGLGSLIFFLHLLALNRLFLR